MAFFDYFGDLVHGFKIAGAGDREAGLDDVHTQAFQLQGEANFFGCVKFATGHLLAVAQGRVKK